MMIKLKHIIFEQDGAGEEAKKRGLKSIGFGRYVDPADPSKVVAKSENGKLVAVKGGEEKSAQKGPGPAASKEKRPSSQDDPGFDPKSGLASRDYGMGTDPKDDPDYERRKAAGDVSPDDDISGAQDVRGAKGADDVKAFVNKPDVHTWLSNMAKDVASGEIDRKHVERQLQRTFSRNDIELDSKEVSKAFEPFMQAPQAPQGATTKSVAKVLSDPKWRNVLNRDDHKKITDKIMSGISDVDDFHDFLTKDALMYDSVADRMIYDLTKAGVIKQDSDFFGKQEPAAPGARYRSDYDPGPEQRKSSGLNPEQTKAAKIIAKFPESKRAIRMFAAGQVNLRHAVDEIIPDLERMGIEMDLNDVEFVIDTLADKIKGRR